jgi:hypothetical protein
MMPALKRMADQGGMDGGGHDMREPLRAIERLLQRMLSENEQGRSQATNELRNELRVLTRTVAASSGNPATPSFNSPNDPSGRSSR